MVRFYLTIYWTIIGIFVLTPMLATHISPSENMSCDSLDQIIKNIYIDDATFSTETQEIAGSLLTIVDTKNCSSLPDVYNLHGIIQYNLNNALESKKYLSKARELLGDGELEYSEMSVRNYLYTGLTHQIDDNFTHAELNFQKASRLSKKIGFNKGILQAHLNLSICFNRFKKYDKAKDILFEATEYLDSLSSKQLGGYIYLILGQTHINEEKFDEAIQLTLSAQKQWREIDFQKGLYFCNSNLAQIYESQKDTTLWIAHLHKLVSYSGNDNSFVRYHPFMILGDYYFNINDHENATLYYEKALEQSNGIPEEELLAIITKLYDLYSLENDLNSIKKINQDVLNIYSYKSDMYTLEAEKWKDKEIELEERNEQNKILELLNVENLKKIKLRNILLVVLFLAFNASLFYIQRFRYKVKIKQEKRSSELRSKISRDLHDDVGSELSAISVQSQLLEAMAGEEIKEIANSIAERSQNAMVNMRDTVWAMDSSSDDLTSLKIKMLDFVFETLDQKKIKRSWKFQIREEDLKLAPNIKQAAYLIFKETVTNIIKHSDTTKVDFNLGASDSHIFMAIIDFGTQKIDRVHSGRGLKNMAIRAQNLGGEYSFHYDQGYTTKFSLPLKTETGTHATF